MEKIACALWKPDGLSDADYGKRLREAAPAWSGRGALALHVNVVDEHVAAGTDVRVGRMDPPKAAFATFWLHEADALRGALLDAIAGTSARVAAYLVVESIPLRPVRTAPRGERTPGFNLVTGIEPKDGLAYDAFLRHWHTEHRTVALETQRSFAYVRNEVVRALTPDAPSWAAIVEEGFPIEALTDPAVWYDADGDAARLEGNRTRMMESCLAFLTLDRVESHPMSEYVFGDPEAEAEAG
jgi:hypothetical protein